MEQEKIKKLLEIVDDQERIRLTVAHNAAITSLKNYSATPTAANRNNMNAAEKELNEQAKKLWEKYVEPPEQTFKNILAVTEYLDGIGYKIKKSSLYLHKKNGLLRPRKDGLFYVGDIKKYIFNAGLKTKDGSPSIDLDKINNEKAIAERDKVVAQVEQIQLRNKAAKGLLVPRDTFERELAQRAIVFKADDESFCRAKAPEIVALVGGDKERIPDLIEFMLAESAKKLNRYAADREFVVPAVAPEEILRDTEEDEDAD